MFHPCLPVTTNDITKEYEASYNNNSICSAFQQHSNWKVWPKGDVWKRHNVWGMVAYFLGMVMASYIWQPDIVMPWWWLQWWDEGFMAGEVIRLTQSLTSHKCVCSEHLIVPSFWYVTGRVHPYQLNRAQGNRGLDITYILTIVTELNHITNELTIQNK
jgi:hypothetical protein